MILTRTAHAKINLFLRIVGRRSDGYHEIETLFQRVSLADRLAFEATDDGALTLSATGIAVPCRTQDNLIFRAAQALREPTGDQRTSGADRVLSEASASQGLRPLGARIALEKRIPTGGGLGGGSSDAAATLLALHEVWALDLTEAALHQIARRLGADVPFFIGGAARAIGRGVGDQLFEVPLPPSPTMSPVSPSTSSTLSTPSPGAPFRIVLAFPDYGVPTADVYRRYDPDRPEPHNPERLPRLVEALARGDLAATLDAAWNEMEGLAFALRPELGALRHRLEKRAGRPVRMSGSGSTLFTLTDSDADAVRIAGAWQGEASVVRIEHLL
jgi:4-diphosphocytidyl-2-C-methyl-D-erythritol kinase